MNDDIYSDDLHEALLEKNNTTFWKFWRSKFDSTNKCIQVDGCVDAIIANNFCSHFKNTFTCDNTQKAESLRNEFVQAYKPFCF